MPQIIIDVPTTEDIQLVRDAFCAMHGYREILLDGTPNPETRAQFTKRMIARHVKSTVRAYKTEIARLQAESSVTDVNVS